MSDNNPQNVNELLHEFIKNINNNQIKTPLRFKDLDSPIEDIFINTINKYLSSDVCIIPQYKVDVPMEFRLDFIIKKFESCIGIECDGKEYHNYYKDQIRDALILDRSCVDTIFRFPGKAIYYSIYNCIYFIYDFFPDLFNQDYVVNLITLTDPTFIEQHEKIKNFYEQFKEFKGPFDDATSFEYGLELPDDRLGERFNFFLKRRTKQQVKKFDCDWTEIYQFFHEIKDVTYEDMQEYFQGFAPFSGF